MIGCVRLESLQLVNMKCFADSGAIALGSVNVFLGPNNGGKSTILRGVRFLQEPNDHRREDIRLGAAQIEVRALISGQGLQRLFGRPTASAALTAVWRGPGQSWNVESIRSDGGRSAHGLFPATEPGNLVYQYLSKRKVAGFQQAVNLTSTTAVEADLRYLVSKVARLANPAVPAHAEYMDMCQQVLGFYITEFASEGGRKPVVLLTTFRT